MSVRKIGGLAIAMATLLVVAAANAEVVTLRCDMTPGGMDAQTYDVDSDQGTVTRIGGVTVAAEIDDRFVTWPAELDARKLFRVDRRTGVVQFYSHNMSNHWYWADAGACARTPKGDLLK